MSPFIVLKSFISNSIKISSEVAAAILKTVSFCITMFFLFSYIISVECELCSKNFIHLGISACVSLTTYIYNTMITGIKFVRYPTSLLDFKFHKKRGLWLLFSLLHFQKLGQCLAYIHVLYQWTDQWKSEEQRRIKKSTDIRTR